MGTKEKAFDVGTARARRFAIDVGRELRIARRQYGLSQVQVANAARISPSQLSRIERAQSPEVSIARLCCLTSVLGLDLAVRAYPAGSPVRDAAHMALLESFHRSLPSILRWELEVPLPIAGDRRAWDANISHAEWRVGVECEMRIRDAQEVRRRIALKVRDDPRIDVVVLLLADTRNNRRLIREHEPELQVDFPLSETELLAALAAREEPAASGIVLLR